jgi:ABC-type metal ion transport system substrate-binding protein
LDQPQSRTVDKLHTAVDKKVELGAVKHEQRLAQLLKQLNEVKGLDLRSNGVKLVALKNQVNQAKGLQLAKQLNLLKLIGLKHLEQAKGVDLTKQLKLLKFVDLKDQLKPAMVTNLKPQLERGTVYPREMFLTTSLNQDSSLGV